MQTRLYSAASRKALRQSISREHYKLPVKRRADHATSALDLEEISSATIRPLRYLTKYPRVDQHPPSQESYGTLTPSLELYLSCNALHTLPGELFNLTNLTVLSLRNNKLTQLPEAIGKLINLVELNVGANKLRWLPWDILELVNQRLKILRVDPNPLFRIPPLYQNIHLDHAASPSTMRHDSTRVHYVKTRLGSTAATFMNIDGSHIRDTPPAPSTQTDSSHLVLSTQSDHSPDTLHGPANPVPSLLELALRECSHSPYLAQLPELLPADSPESVSRLLYHAHSIKEGGGRLCSVCGREYIVARTEWVEWWDFLEAYEDPWTSTSSRYGVPLLRRACSWQCVPSHLA